jgi:tRNA pseudouridine55 synthase
MNDLRRGGPVHGWVVLDKPLGITAARATARVKRLLGAAKAGHAGTLDPLASGVLPVAVGEATKTVSLVMERSKTYRFSARWGEARDTDDAEGRIVATSGVRPNAADIERGLGAFRGAIVQRPPIYSAIKVAGERAYELARRGQEPSLRERSVMVHQIDLIGCQSPDEAEFRVECGKGFYIRSLVRDLAKVLGTVAYVSALRRERVGPFDQACAILLADLEAVVHNAPARGASEYGPFGVTPAILRPIETALDDIPALALTGRETDRLKSGRAVPVLHSEDRLKIDRLESGATFLGTAHGVPVGLLRWDGALVHPLRLFNL